MCVRLINGLVPEIQRSRTASRYNDPGKYEFNYRKIIRRQLNCCSDIMLYITTRNNYGIVNNNNLLVDSWYSYLHKTHQKTVFCYHCAIKVPFYTHLEDECTKIIKTKDTLILNISRNVTRLFRNHIRMSFKEEHKICAILVTRSPILDNGQAIGQIIYRRKDVRGQRVRFEPTLHRFLLIHWFASRSEGGKRPLAIVAYHQSNRS